MVHSMLLPVLVAVAGVLSQGRGVAAITLIQDCLTPIRERTQSHRAVCHVRGGSLLDEDEWLSEEEDSYSEFDDDNNEGIDFATSSSASPFLEHFHGEVRAIVDEYRKEMRDTFQQLKRSLSESHYSDSHLDEFLPYEEDEPQDPQTYHQNATTSVSSNDDDDDAHDDDKSLDMLFNPNKRVA